MKPSELEYKILGILDRVVEKQPIEDSLVELKRDWIEPYKAARQIAGHANVAQGAAIIWIVGVDEEAREIKGAEMEELANWLPQVHKHFDQLYPELIQVLTQWEKRVEGVKLQLNL